MNDLVLDLINTTSNNIFLTGKAGTGKTTTLRRIVSSTYKNVVVAAPTGIAALNANGVTLHSLFQLPFGAFIPQNIILDQRYLCGFSTPLTLPKQIKMHQSKRKLLERMELLIIDEVSMLRCDTLDMIDLVLKKTRRNARPFGGVQVLFVGDLLQLPPVIKDQEWDVLKQFYNGYFFFHSKVIERTPLVYIELEKVYRQSDKVFISILNNLRNNVIEPCDLEFLSNYVREDFNQEPHEGYITLTTHNSKAEAINTCQLNKLQEKEFIYRAEVVDDFPAYMYPVELQLRLKKGAQVMFIKNDTSPEKQFYNGKIGKVVYLDEFQIKVESDGKIISVEKYEWQNFRYRVDGNGNISEEILGTFTHFPLRTAWAITIHKSQGLTFERAIVDLGSVFAPGQAYVALSRLKSLDGLVLLSDICDRGLTTSDDVVAFSSLKQEPEQLRQILERDSLGFIQQEVTDAFSLSDLSMVLYSHSATYVGEAGYKSNNKAWAESFYADFSKLSKIAESFKGELYKIFKSKDLIRLNDRCQKAFAYFFPALDKMSVDLAVVYMSSLNKKGAKSYSGELRELFDMFVDMITRIMKATSFVRTYVEKQELTKENICGNRVTSYRENTIQRGLDRINSELLLKKEGEKKQSDKGLTTTQKTLALLRQGLDICDIAKERKLTQSTIYGHIQKLISGGDLDIEDFLTTQQVKEIEDAIDLGDLSLTEVMKKTNQKYTFEQIKLVLGYLSYRDKQQSS